VIELKRGAQSPAHDAALARARREIEKSAIAATQPSLSTGTAESAELQAAIDALWTPERARPALVYLAGRTGARLCEEVALVADDASMTSMSEALRWRIGDEKAALSGAETLGWQLDRTAFEVLGYAMGENKLPPELSAVLAAYGGEAGRHSSSLEAIGRGVTSRLDFENRIVAENLIYLEDSSPSSRVRAYDWLHARGRAPAGFDPLGPAKERRKAIDQMLSSPAPNAVPATSAPSGGRP
jgi:hypothetical protein